MSKNRYIKTHPIVFDARIGEIASSLGIEALKLLKLDFCLKEAMGKNTPPGLRLTYRDEYQDSLINNQININYDWLSNIIKDLYIDEKNYGDDISKEMDKLMPEIILCNKINHNDNVLDHYVTVSKDFDNIDKFFWGSQLEIGFINIIIELAFHDFCNEYNINSEDVKCHYYGNNIDINTIYLRVFNNSIDDLVNSYRIIVRGEDKAYSMYDYYILFKNKLVENLHNIKQLC